MKKIILSIGVFIFYLLLFPSNAGAQTFWDCNDKWKTERYACEGAIKSCYEACSAPEGIADESCYKGCDNTNKSCQERANANNNACQEARKKPTVTPTVVPSASPGNEDCWRKHMQITGCLPKFSECMSQCPQDASPAQRACEAACHKVSSDCSDAALANYRACAAANAKTREEGTKSEFQDQPKPAPSTSSDRPEGFFDIFEPNPFNTWRNIQGLVNLAPGMLDSLIGTGEFLFGYPELLPEPAINTDIQDGTYDFLPGYIPGESIYQDKPISTGEILWLIDEERKAYFELRPGQSKKAVLKTPKKDENGLPFLEEGEIEIVKEPSGTPDSGYSGIKTPNGMVVSVQTHYLVKYDKENNQTTVVVYEGKVEVKTNDGKMTTVAPKDDKPGVVIIAQKLSPVKLAIAGSVLVVVLGGVLLLLKKKVTPKSSSKKKK